VAEQDDHLGDEIRSEEAYAIGWSDWVTPMTDLNDTIISMHGAIRFA